MVSDGDSDLRTQVRNIRMCSSNTDAKIKSKRERGSRKQEVPHFIGGNEFKMADVHC